MSARKLLLTAGLGVALAGVAPGAAPALASHGPKVEIMVVGKERTLAWDRTVRAPTLTVDTGDRRCEVRSGTPLAALEMLDRNGGPGFRLRDYGACSRTNWRDAGGLFVTQIRGDRNEGRDGWVYKLDNRAGSVAAAAPSGPFGDSRFARTGDRILWFWCELEGPDGCQRTLDVSVWDRRISPGGTIGVTVFGYDNEGERVRVRGATVAIGRERVVTDGRGVARARAPRERGTVRIRAKHDDMVTSFAEQVTVR